MLAALPTAATCYDCCNHPPKSTDGDSRDTTENSLPHHRDSSYRRRVRHSGADTNHRPAKRRGRVDHSRRELVILVTQAFKSVQANMGHMDTEVEQTVNIRQAAIRAVVFDMDGLMFNTEDVYFDAIDEILIRRGKRYDRRLAAAMMGGPLQNAFEVMIRRHNLDATWQQLVIECEGTFLRLLDHRLTPMPGLLELLAALEAAGIAKAIATSSRRKLVHEVLSRFDLGPRFAFVLTAEDVTHGKPDPEVYREAARRFAVASAEMLVLEDSENGCRAAAGSGAYTVAVPGVHSDNQDFSFASLRVSSLADRRLYEVLELVPSVRTFHDDPTRKERPTR